MIIRKILILIISSFLLIAAGSYSIYPIYTNSMSKRFGFSSAQINLYSTFVDFGFFIALPMGYIYDKYGHKISLIISSILIPGCYYILNKLMTAEPGSHSIFPFLVVGFFLGQGSILAKLTTISLNLKNFKFKESSAMVGLLLSNLAISASIFSSYKREALPLITIEAFFKYMAIFILIVIVVAFMFFKDLGEKEKNYTEFQQFKEKKIIVILIWFNLGILALYIIGITINNLTGDTKIPNFIIFPILKTLNFIVIVLEINKYWDENIFRKYIEKETLKQQLKWASNIKNKSKSKKKKGLLTISNVKEINSTTDPHKIYNKVKLNKKMKKMNNTLKENLIDNNQIQEQEQSEPPINMKQRIRSIVKNNGFFDNIKSNFKRIVDISDSISCISGISELDISTIETHKIFSKENEQIVKGAILKNINEDENYLSQSKEIELVVNEDIAIEKVESIDNLEKNLENLENDKVKIEEPELKENEDILEKLDEQNNFDEINHEPYEVKIQNLEEPECQTDIENVIKLEDKIIEDTTINEDITNTNTRINFSESKDIGDIQKKKHIQFECFTIEKCINFSLEVINEEDIHDEDLSNISKSIISEEQIIQQINLQKKKNKEKQEQELIAKNAINELNKDRFVIEESEIDFKEILKTQTIWILFSIQMITEGIIMSNLNNISYFIRSIVEFDKATDEYIDGYIYDYVIIFFIFNSIARLIVGLAISKYIKQNNFYWCIVLVSFILLTSQLLGLFMSPGIFFISISLLGVVQAGLMTFTTMFVRIEYGLKNVGKLLGFLYLGNAIGTLIISNFSFISFYRYYSNQDKICHGKRCFFGGFFINSCLSLVCFILSLRLYIWFKDKHFKKKTSVKIVDEIKEKVLQTDISTNNLLQNESVSNNAESIQIDVPKTKEIESNEIYEYNPKNVENLQEPILEDSIEINQEKPENLQEKSTLEETK